MNGQASLSSPADGRLWPAVWKLLRLRLVIFKCEWRRAKIGRKIGMAALGVLLVGGMALAFALSWMLLTFLRSPRLADFIGDTGSLLASIPVMVLTAVCIGALLTSFGVLLQALYLAGDMDFLLSAPLPIRSIFLTKLLQAILPNLGLVLVFALPVLFGLGASGGYSFIYYPLVVVTLALITLAVAGLASLLVMAVVRIFPARRVAEVLGFLVAIITLVLSQSGQFANSFDLSEQQANQALGMVQRFNTPWSPLTWAGRGLVDIGEGRWLLGGLLALLTIAVTAGIFAICLAAAERLYYSGWASVQVSTRKKKNGRPRRRAAGAGAAAGLSGSLLPAAVRGIIAKDFMMLRRDLRNMSQVVTPLILGVLYAFLLLRRGGGIPEGRGEAPEFFTDALQNVMVYANVGIALFVGWSLLSRLATMGFSQEGKHYWLLKSAPVSTGKLLAAKYLVAFLPTAALGVVFLTAISLMRPTSVWTVLFSLCVVLLTLAGLAALSLTFGVLGANFDWVDPRRISQGSAGCFGVIASVAFLLLSLGLFFGPALLLGFFEGPPALGQWIGLLLGGVFSLAAGFVPLWLVRERVARLAEG